MDVRGADLRRPPTTKRAPFGVRNNQINNNNDREWYNSGYCIRWRKPWSIKEHQYHFPIICQRKFYVYWSFIVGIGVSQTPQFNHQVDYLQQILHQSSIMYTSTITNALGMGTVLLSSTKTIKEERSVDARYVNIWTRRRRPSGLRRRSKQMWNRPSTRVRCQNLYLSPLLNPLLHSNCTQHLRGNQWILSISLMQIPTITIYAQPPDTGRTGRIELDKKQQQYRRGQDRLRGLCYIVWIDWGGGGSNSIKQHCTKLYWSTIWSSTTAEWIRLYPYLGGILLVYQL